MNVDLSAILVPIVQIAGIGLTGLAGWAILKVADYAHISKQNVALQTLLGGVDRAISFAQQVALKDVDAHDTIAVQNALTASAANYVIQKLPGTLKTLGIDVTTTSGQQHIADLILSKLPPA